MKDRSKAVAGAVARALEVPYEGQPTASAVAPVPTSGQPDHSDDSSPDSSGSGCGVSGGNGSNVNGGSRDGVGGTMNGSSSGSGGDDHGEGGRAVAVARASAAAAAAAAVMGDGFTRPPFRTRSEEELRDQSWIHTIGTL